MVRWKSFLFEVDNRGSKMLGRVSKESLPVCTMMLGYLHDIRLIMERPHSLGIAVVPGRLAFEEQK